MEKAFVAFGPDHLAAIALAFVVPVALGIVVRQSGSRRLARALALAFAAELIATWILWYWLIASRGWISVSTILPMQLCDWAAVAAIVALVRPTQKSYELTYFWALSGTLQALLTPDLCCGFPDIRFIVFFAFHDGAIAAALYLLVACRMRPVPASLPRVIAWSLVYFVAALAVNAVFHTNFGFLGAKPVMPSLLDLMGPWPIYDFELLGLGMGFLVLLYLPFFLADRLRRPIVSPGAAEKNLPFRPPPC
ncbi:MAG: TIGR02206 family membrane protein [Rhizomicrobium sp.]